jgi:hypothetical protein
MRDPVTGEQVIKGVYKASEIYHGPYAEKGPDLVVGYARGYRASFETALGKFPVGPIIEDNTGKWSGDHCIDPREVPGVLVANRPLQVSDPNLRDISVTVLNEFGLKPGPEMRGRPLFGEPGERGEPAQDVKALGYVN